jgi:hypothetical protein
MALFSIAIPAIKGYLDAKGGALMSGGYCGGQKMSFALFWLIAVIGGFFALSGLYEYFNSIYTPILAKGYMALACFAFSIGGWILTFLINGIVSFFQKKKTPAVDLHAIEEHVKDIVKTVQSDGAQLIKQHPFASLLMGASVGLLSGMVLFTKQK